MERTGKAGRKYAGAGGKYPGKRRGQSCAGATETGRRL